MNQAMDEVKAWKWKKNDLVEQFHDIVNTYMYSITWNSLLHNSINKLLNKVIFFHFHALTLSIAWFISAVQEIVYFIRISW
jgi:hypothetical protein